MHDDASDTDAGATARFVTISRTFDASPGQVFRLWTRPELLARWYAPRRCQLEVLKFEFREGGEFRHRIREPDGSGCLCSSIFTEIAPDERIVYRLNFCDEQGRFVTARSAGADPDWPDRTIVTVTFVENGGRTTMTLHQTVAESVAKRTGAHPSWVEMIERLAEQLTDEDSHR
jgi:uncharacterized protein YndB with AHSA1/START domain